MTRVAALIACALPMIASAVPVGRAPADLSAVATRPAVPRVMLPPSLLNNNSSANSSSKPNDAGVQQPLETKCKADTEEACQALVGCKWCMTIDLEWCQPAAKVKCKE